MNSMVNEIPTLTAEETQTLKDMKVVDADTHYTEPHDLWTSMVPASMKDKVPHVIRKDNGRDVWLVDGEQVLLESAVTACSIMKDGSKFSFWDVSISEGPQIEEVSEASWDIKSRVAAMDDMNIWAQIVYPNVVGFGSQRLIHLKDRQLSLDIASIYNEAMAQKQELSGNRFLPQAVIPFWDLKAAVKEVEKAKNMGLTGIAVSPQPDHGTDLPDIGHTYWDPLWEVCQDLDMPINFHIGADPAGMAGRNPWDDVWGSMDRHRKYVIGCALLESGQASILANLVCSDLLDRFPKTKWVNVESGIGWIPYILERLEYQFYESDPQDPTLVNYDRPSPWELFHRQIYACWWFEHSSPTRMLDIIGFDNVLFETDFPHPTCLYPSPAERAFKTLEHWGPEARNKVMSGNAARVYNIPGLV
ncbi:amidohydrolase family protein [Novosphingobium bradum]|uniref:Amidohydrolase family protein n=1 Tax=Novosphingobium bradum TaxID=1737444 RepID=A0ABV7IVV8_9SPHN